MTDERNIWGFNVARSFILHNYMIYHNHSPVRIQMHTHTQDILIL